MSLLTDTTTTSNSGMYQAIQAGAGNNPVTSSSHWTRISGDPMDTTGVTQIVYTSNDPGTNEIVEAFAPTSITFLNGSVGLVGNLPDAFTIVDGRRYSVQIASTVYNGTIVVPSSAVTQNASGWFFDTNHAEATASPAVPGGTAISSTSNTATIFEVNPTGTMNSITGEVIFTGPGVSFNPVTDTLTFGGASNAFVYSQLLTSGFLLPEVPAMDTSTREAFQDTTGAYGAVNAYYWFSDTDGSWYDVSTGGTALATFID